MRKFWGFFLFCTILGSFTTAQTVTYVNELPQKHRKSYNEVVEQINKGEFDKAAEGLGRLIDRYPGLIEAQIRLGELQMNKSNFGEAEIYIKKALDLDSNFHQRLYLTMASILKAQGKFDKATEFYRKFLSNCDGSPTFCDRVRKDLKQTEFAAEAVDNSYSVNLRSLGEPVNSPESEYLVSFDISTSQIIFTRRVNGQEDLYYSSISEGVFSQPKSIVEINTIYNEGAHCLSSDGKILIFTACEYRDSYGGCDLYYSMFANGHWSKPINLGQHINSRFWDAQPSLSADGNQLYFSSNRPGGSGEKDIWMSELDERGAWKPARNLGRVINTSGNESSPFIHADNSTLYFRSDGHTGMGDYDIFISKRSEDSDWGHVKNLGYPINSPGSDGALTVTLDGKTAFYAQEVFDDSGRGHLDIFTFELPDDFKPKNISYAQIEVKDYNSGNLVKTDLLIIDHFRSDTVFAGNSREYGNLIIPLETGANYFLQVSHPEYIYHSEYISLDTVVGHSTPFIFSIELHKKPAEEIPADHPIVLNNIFFETGSAILLPASTLEIQALANFLKDDPDIKMKIVGHTDEVGDTESNLKLSEERAKSVYRALADLGISASRLSYVGKGESEPVANNKTPEGRKKNRRTEFVIIES